MEIPMTWYGLVRVVPGTRRKLTRGNSAIITTHTTGRYQEYHCNTSTIVAKNVRSCEFAIRSSRASELIYEGRVVKIVYPPKFENMVKMSDARFFLIFFWSNASCGPIVVSSLPRPQLLIELYAPTGRS
jgi:hypothetical protein